MDVIVAAQWNPRQPNLVALASKENSIVVIDIESRQEVTIRGVGKGKCQELRWNLGENLFLALEDPQLLSLYSTEAGQKAI
jgi:hypothetical protein